MKLKSILCLGTLCANGFTSGITDVEITNTEELSHFAVQVSCKINTANHVYGAELKKLQPDEDEIRINVSNSSNTDTNAFRDFAHKTIPDVVADCALRQNKFHPGNVVGGLVEF